MVNHPNRQHSVAVAQAKCEIVRLRNLARWQREDYAAGLRRQAMHPVYPGQTDVCMRKASQLDGLADANEAAADLIQAKINAGEIA